MEEEEEENTGLQPVHLGFSFVALLLAGLFLYTTYTTDQTPNRVSDYLFGTPKTGDDAGYTSSSSANDDSDSEDDSDADDDE